MSLRLVLIVAACSLVLARNIDRREEKQAPVSAVSAVPVAQAVQQTSTAGPDAKPVVHRRAAEDIPPGVPAAPVVAVSTVAAPIVPVPSKEAPEVAKPAKRSLDEKNEHEAEPGCCG